jgi:hypothetical protein
MDFEGANANAGRGSGLRYGTGLPRDCGLGVAAIKVNAISSVRTVCSIEMQLNLRVRGPKKSLGSCLVEGTLIICLVVVDSRLTDEAVIQLDARRFMLLRVFPKLIWRGCLKFAVEISEVHEILPFAFVTKADS